MLPDTQETKKHFSQTMTLVHKILYKTIEFQILFKIFYIGILVFIINFLIGIFVDAINLLITSTKLNEAVSSIPFMSLFDFQVISVLVISLLIFLYVYLVEKNGVIIITTEYYRNNFISFFKALFLSIQKTPRFILRRIYEMRIVIIFFVGMYVMWKLLSIFALPEQFVSVFGWLLAIYGAWIFFTLLFKYTFTAYTTCLHPDESYQEFNTNIPEKFLHKRTHVTIIFYAIFIVIALLWLILFSIITQTLIYFSEIYPDMISTLLAFFISFTIISILFVLSFMKTFKVAIMTILYYKERKRQQKQIQILPINKQPRLSKSLKLSILTIISIITIAGLLLTTTLKIKTDTVINNAQEYIEQIQEQNQFSPETLGEMKNMDPQDFIQTILTHETSTSTLDAIEKFVFTFLAYLLVR